MGWQNPPLRAPLTTSVLPEGKREKMQGSWILNLLLALDTFKILKNNNEQVLFLLKQPEPSFDRAHLI